MTTLLSSVCVSMATAVGGSGGGGAVGRAEEVIPLYSRVLVVYRNEYYM